MRGLQDRPTFQISQSAPISQFHESLENSGLSLFYAQNTLFAGAVCVSDMTFFVSFRHFFVKQNHTKVHILSRFGVEITQNHTKITRKYTAERPYLRGKSGFSPALFQTRSPFLVIRALIFFEKTGKITVDLRLIFLLLGGKLPDIMLVHGRGI